MAIRRETASFVTTAALVYLTVVGFSVARVSERSTLRRPTATTTRDFHVGASFTYELSAARAIATEGGRKIRRTTIGGRLTFVIVSATKESVKVRAQLSDPRRDALSAPFFVTIRSDGAIASFTFPKSTSEDARQELQAVVTSLQLVTPDRAFDARWERVESDEAGRYVAAYDRTSGRIEKTKLRYELVRTPDGLVPPGTIGRRDDVRSAIAIAVAPSGWPSSVAEDATVVTAFEDGAHEDRRVTTTTRTVAMLEQDR